MPYKAWICERCHRPHTRRANIWDCPGCGQETCEECFWTYGHCEKCCAGKTFKQLAESANASGDFNFDIPDEPEASRVYRVNR